MRIRSQAVLPCADPCHGDSRDGGDHPILQPCHSDVIVDSIPKVATEGTLEDLTLN